MKTETENKGNNLYLPKPQTGWIPVWLPGQPHWDPPSQSHHGLLQHPVHLHPTRLWRVGVGEAPAVAVQCCGEPVGKGHLFAIPILPSKGGPASAGRSDQ